MARIRQITSKDDVAPDKEHIFDAIIGSRGHISGPFSVLLQSPEVAGRVAHLGTYIRFESTLRSQDRELAILTTSREFDCDYEWSLHVTLALQAGVRGEAIETVAKGYDLDALTPEEALIVSYGRELFRGHQVSEETFEAARVRFGDQGVTDLTATMGYYGMLACVLNALKVDPDPGTPRLP